MQFTSIPVDGANSCLPGFVGLCATMWQYRNPRGCLGIGISLLYREPDRESLHGACREQVIRISRTYCDDRLELSRNSRRLTIAQAGNVPTHRESTPESDKGCRFNRINYSGISAGASRSGHFRTYSTMRNGPEGPSLYEIFMQLSFVWLFLSDPADRTRTTRQQEEQVQHRRSFPIQMRSQRSDNRL